MAKKRYSSNDIISKLRAAEVLLSQEKTVSEVARKLEISEQTYYRWKKEYGGLDKTQVRRLKELEKENTQLKKLVQSRRSGTLPGGWMNDWQNYARQGAGPTGYQ